MALNFPNSPVVGQIYQSGSLSWRWDGTSWVSQGTQAISGTLVSANSGPILSGVSLNFVNTATVQVSVASSGSNVANIGFTSTAGGTGTVTQVNTGTGLTGGGFTTSGTISANIANTTIQGVTKLIDVVTSNDSGNAATANIVNIAFNQATNAYNQANTANSIAISAYGQANAAYTQANTANSIAISAFGQANAAYAQANAAYTQANSANSIAISAYGQANAAYNQANSANSIAISAYGQANAAYIQANSATLIATSAFAQANLAYTQANVANSIAISAYGQANAAFTAANNAANTTRVSANGGAIQSSVSLNFVNTSTVQVTVSPGGTGVANISFISSATAVGGSGINTFPVSVNTGSTISANGINFVNSATVTVSVTQGINGNANVSFTSISGGTGTVTRVDTGIGLAGGGFTTTGTITANIASTTVQGITKLIDSVTSTDTANAATGAAVKVAFGQATDAYGQANVGYTQANLAFTQANTANSIGVSAYGQANLAFTTANNAANTVRVYANSGSVQSAVSLNFINTSSVLVSVGAGSAGNANVSFSAVAGSTTVPGILQLNDNETNSSTTTAATPRIVKLAADQANSAYGQANLAFTAANNAANTVRVYANSGSVQSAVSLNFINTSSVLVSVGPGSTGNANVSFSAVAGSTTVPGIVQLNDTVINNSTTLAPTANALKTTYDFAATKYSSTGGTISGDVTITGNLILTGGSSQLNVTNLSVNDTIILLGTNNISDVLDIGFVGHYRRGATDTHAGIIRKASDKIFYVFENYEVEPTNNVIDINGNNFRLGNVRLGIMNANSILVLGTPVATTTDVGFAYGQANVAYTQANLAFAQANIAYTQANTGYTQANLAFSQANTANTTAVSAFNQANLAYAAANSAANLVRVTANGGSIQSNVSLNFVNTSTVQVSVTSGGAGVANISFISSATAVGGSGINTFPVSANAGATVSANGINFINSATVTVTVTPGINGNANVSFTSTGGAGTPGGSNTQIQFNNNGSFGGSPKFTYNTSPNLVSVDADLKLANTNKLYFGGEQANNSVANSKFSISFNVSATSLDFTFLG